MKHTRVLQTVRRDIWQLAIETSSIPSLHSYRSRILRNQVASRVENRKEPNGPNRRPNQLTKKNIPHTLFHYYLGWLIRWKVCISHEPFFQKQRCRRNHNCRTLFQTKQVCFAQTLYQPQSALPYLGYCTLSSFSSTKGPREGQKNPIDKGVEMCSPWNRSCCWWWRWRWLGVAPKKFGRPVRIKFIKY